MVDGDALFCYQFLVPIVEPKRLGIKDDPSLPFYTDCVEFTNLYAIVEKEWNGK